MLAAVGAFAVMESALFAHDFSLKFVADNVARATPGLYTFTAAWSALEGSILLWALALSAYVAFTTWHFRHRAEDPVVAWATLVQLVVLGFFFVLMLFPANPFKVLHGAIPADGQGPNPLLQNNPLVVIHPPILYAGYVGFTIPFSFAVAALATGRFGEGWLADVRRTTLVAFGFLTVGIVLGALWSYAVLGWGGYWGWDPVENASLLPWLTATAFIHSVMVQERRGMLRVWNLSLVIATFCLTILGTFLTRSGVLNSVHAFSNSPIGPWLLTFLAPVRGDGGRAHRLARRRVAIAGPDRFAAVARGGLPAQQPAVRRVRVGRAHRHRVPAARAGAPEQADHGGRAVFRQDGRSHRARAAVPDGDRAGVAVAGRERGDAADAAARARPGSAGWCSSCVSSADARGIADVIAFALGAFVLASVGRSVAIGIRARKRATKESPLVALVRAVRGNPRLYGGLLVHAGVVVLALALATTVGLHDQA